MDRALSPHPPALVPQDEHTPVLEKGQVDTQSSVVSITFTVDDRVGVLKDVLEIFASRGISLSLLESRPGALGSSYDFFVQYAIENNHATGEIVSALDDLPSCKNIIVLSSEEG